MSGKNFKVEVAGVQMKVPRAVVAGLVLAHVNDQPIKLPALASVDIPRVGEVWPGQGGKYAGIVRGENGARDYRLICVGFVVRGVWGAQDQSVEGACSPRDGHANTIAMAASAEKNDIKNCVAMLVRDIDADGHKDCHIAAPLEATLCKLNAPEFWGGQDGWYYTSQQSSSGLAWFQDFENGYQYNGVKGNERPALVVRRLFI